MTTLADYTTAVEAKGVESITTVGAVPAAINAARRRIVNARRWTFLEAATDSSLVTAYGSAGVTVSPTWRIDAVRSVQGTDTWELEYRGVQELRRLQSLDTTPGTPQYWSKRAGQIILFPVADGVYTLAVDYVAETVVDLVASTDVETLLEPAMIDAVAWAATKDLAFRSRDYAAAQFAESEYQMHLATAIRDDATQQRQSSRQVVSNPNRFEGR